MGSRRIASVLAAALLGLLAVSSCHLGDDMLKAVADVRAGFKVAPPEFSAAAGDYTNDFTFTLSCPTDGASIRYTVDGSPPRSDYGVQYQGAPIPVNGTTTFKAVAYKPKWNDSAVTTTLYRMVVADPAIAPPGGIYGSAQSVTLSCTTVGASLRYTIDDPDLTPTTGMVFTAPFAISDTKTVRALACKANYSNSQVVQATYSIGKCSAPFFTPGTGTFTADTAVDISSGTAGTEIYYTTDGATPTLASPHGPIPVTVTVTKTATMLKAFATHPSLLDSAVAASGTFTLKVADPTFSPAAGTYTGSQSVTIDSSTTGRIIRYTTNGTDPTMGAVYSTPISVSSNLTLRAIATKTDYDNSAIVDAAYTIRYTLTMANDGHGSTTPSGTTAVVSGSPTAISASAATGYHFLNWTTVPPSDPDAAFGDPNSSSTTVTLTGDATVKANFAINQYTLTMTNDGHGTTTPSGAPSVNHGAATAISASASASYCFSEWVATVNPGNVVFGSSTAASTTVTLTGPATVQARFTDHAFASSAGSASNTGRSASSPKKTVADGIAVAQANAVTAVWIAAGTYPESVTLVPHVSILGGYNSAFTTRDIPTYISKLTSTTVTNPFMQILGDGSTIANDVLIEGLTIEITWSGSTQDYWCFGFRCQNGASPNIRSNTIVINNSVNDSVAGDRDYTYGICVGDNPAAYVYTMDIANNTIFVCRKNANSWAAYGIGVSGMTTGSSLTIQKNRIVAYDNYNGAALWMQMCKGVVVKNNILSFQGAGADKSAGIWWLWDTEAKITNNTIYIDNLSGATQYGIFKEKDETLSSVELANNIICTVNGTGTGIYANTGGITKYDYNLCFGFPTHISGAVTDGGHNQYTATNVFGSVFVSVTADTDLQDGDSANYHLNGSDSTYAYNKGVDASGATYGSVTDDIDAEARPKGGAWDRGCDER